MAHGGKCASFLVSRVLIKLARVVTHKLVFSKGYKQALVNKKEDVQCIAEVRLGHSSEAMPGLSVAMADAMPHQLVNRLCGQVWPSLSPGAHRHLIHGMDATPDGSELILKLVVQARCRMFHSVGRQLCRRNRSQTLL